MRIVRSVLIGLPFLIIGLIFDNWGVGWLCGIAWTIIVDIVNDYYKLKKQTKHNE